MSTYREVADAMSTYREVAEQLAALVEKKQAAYGDAHGPTGVPAMLCILFPKGIPVERYADVPGITRVAEKLFRLASAPAAFGESPWDDVAGYGLVGAGYGLVGAKRARDAKPAAEPPPQGPRHDILEVLGPKRAKPEPWHCEHGYGLGQRCPGCR